MATAQVSTMQSPHQENQLGHEHSQEHLQHPQQQQHPNQVSESELARIVYKAKLAEQIERFPEMCQLIRHVIRTKGSLAPEEQWLFAVAHKNVLAKSRAAWRIAVVAREKYASTHPDRQAAASSYVNQLAAEIMQLCDELDLDLDALRPHASDPLSRALYAKMSADNRRYRAEVDPRLKPEALEAYNRAMGEAAQLPPGDAVRLGVALNYAVFLYEQMEDTQSACRITQDALENARKNPPEDRHRERMLIDRMLRDNLDLWTSEEPNKPQ